MTTTKQHESSRPLENQPITPDACVAMLTSSFFRVYIAQCTACTATFAGIKKKYEYIMVMHNDYYGYFYYADGLLSRCCDNAS